MAILINPYCFPKMHLLIPFAIIVIASKSKRLSISNLKVLPHVQCDLGKHWNCPWVWQLRAGFILLRGFWSSCSRFTEVEARCSQLDLADRWPVRLPGVMGLTSKPWLCISQWKWDIYQVGDLWGAPCMSVWSETPEISGPDNTLGITACKWAGRSSGTWHNTLGSGELEMAKEAAVPLAHPVPTLLKQCLGVGMCWWAQTGHIVCASATSTLLII